MWLPLGECAVVERVVARALTIAGSDSSGGAGIEADLKTFTALGVYGMAAVTSVTAQNTTGVIAAHHLPPALVAQQINAVAGDIGIDAAKTGMLANARIIEAVAACVAAHHIPNLVVDPVMVASSGARLLEASACAILKERLLPLAFLLTPNIPEAEALTGMTIRDPNDVRNAAQRLHETGVRYVLIKGGHLNTAEAADYLYDGAGFHEFTAARVNTSNTHGTGCTYSAAIAAYLAKGIEVIEAVRQAKAYVTEAIRHGFQLGNGPGPLNHFWSLANRAECRMQNEE